MGQPPAPCIGPAAVADHPAWAANARCLRVAGRMALANGVASSGPLAAKPTQLQANSTPMQRIGCKQAEAAGLRLADAFGLTPLALCLAVKAGTVPGCCCFCRPWMILLLCYRIRSCCK